MGWATQDWLVLDAVAIAAFFAAALLAGVLRRGALAIVYPVTIAAAAVALWAHGAALLQGTVVSHMLPVGVPGVGMRFRLDTLSAYFGIIINTGLVAAGLYGLGLDRRSELSARVEPFYAAFAGAMNIVLIADDAFSFLFAWETMSLSSWALVVSRHTDPECRRAGHVYLLMAVFGTLALLLTFGALAGPAGGYAFETMRAARAEGAVATLVLVAVLIGAGSKAGIMPLHAWLPLAHPAAPSHVSALMSGVMTKVAIYAVVRVVFDLLGAPQWWWALPFIVLGAATAVGGLLHAVLDEDLKRILAYSTVENIGIIFVGLGFAIAFKASALPAAGAVAMAAALLHALNHSWFKSLLFLGAGAVLHATGRRDLDGLGGLIHGMPKTAFFFLVGALAISALPPLNGFVSEWLLFQAVLAGPGFPEPLLRFLSPAVGAMLALAAGLAAACFVRAFGIVFLGRPRTPAAAEAHEAPPVQRFAMGLLAVLCLLGGLLGSVSGDLIGPLLQQLVGAALPGSSGAPTPVVLVAFDPARSTYDAPIIALFVLMSSATTAFIVHRISNRRTRRAPAWDCGFPDPSPLTQYSGSSLGQPLRRVYGSFVFGARESVTMPPPGEPGAARLEVSMSDYVWRWAYAAPAALVLVVSLRLNALQFLTIRRYLVLMFFALIVLLVLTGTWV